MPQSSTSVIGPDLRSALVAMVRKRVPESEIEDIVQSTLADAIESDHAPADSESLRRWIFGIAKNKVVDYHRRAGRESFELPEVPGKPAPHVEADLLRWAEKNLPPGEENATTLDWMLREGEGEKLESIAETELVPAPRVRQRVSRLRRHFKTHWQKEVALLVALGVVASLVVLAMRRSAPNEIAPDEIAREVRPRAEELRRHGLADCRAEKWRACLDALDAAKALDPAGDTRPEIERAREGAAAKLAPVSPENVTPPPAPSGATSAPAPGPSAATTLVPPARLFAPKTQGTEAPFATPTPPAVVTSPTPPAASGLDSDGLSSLEGKEKASTKLAAPSKKRGFDAK